MMTIKELIEHLSHEDFDPDASVCISVYDESGDASHNIYDFGVVEVGEHAELLTTIEKATGAER